VRANLPGCRHPDVTARRAQGGADAQLRPHPRWHPVAHLLNRDLLAGLRGPCHLLLPRAEVPRTGDSSSNPESVAESGNVAWQRGEQICRAELSAFRLILMASDRCRRWQDERLSRW